MEIRYSTAPFPELEFSGSATDFSELAQALFNGDGEIAANNGAKPDPYRRFGSRIMIKTVPRMKVIVAINQQEIAITGDTKWLSILAQNIDGLRKDAKVPYHAHIEFFQNHPYLDPNSFPLVCSLKAQELFAFGTSN
jgi:hypothetical protein